MLGHTAARFSAKPHWTMTSAVVSADSRVEQTAQDRRATVERQARDDLERLSRQRHPQDVLDADIDVWVPAPQAFGKPGIDLDGHDSRARAHERAGQDTGSSAEIENEVVGLNARSANQLRGQLVTAEKVLAAPARSRSNGHGRPPRP